jgi:hypothetical protein
MTEIQNYHLALIANRKKRNYKTSSKISGRRKEVRIQDVNLKKVKNEFITLFPDFY